MTGVGETLGHHAFFVAIGVTDEGVPPGFRFHADILISVFVHDRLLSFYAPLSFYNNPVYKLKGRGKSHSFFLFAQWQHNEKFPL